MTIRSENRSTVPNLKKLAARGLLAFGLFLMGNFAILGEAQAYLQFFRTDGGEIYEYDDEVCQYDVANKTLTLISNGSVVPVGSAAYTTKLTNTNDRGWLLNSQGYTVSLPGSPYPVFANGNPVMNNLGQLLTTDGDVIIHSPQYEEFNEAYVKPGWDNGQMPTADGINRSGVIDLNDCPDNIFSTGYNGSNLTYYFNDEDAKLYDQRAAMISNVTFCAANIAAAAAATTAAAVAIVIDPSAIVIAGAQTLTATGLTAAAAADLAIFDKYSENFVGAIDFNSSLTVKNTGALHGTYQNIETLLLESAAGDVQLGSGSADQRGDFIVIDKIESKGKLIVNAYGNVAEVNSIVAETLTNNGTINNVGYLSAAQMENTGTMTAVGTLVASNLTNTNTGTISAETTTIGKKLDNKGTFVNYGQLNAQTLDNSGTLIANGALNVGTTSGGTFGTITNSGTLLANGTVSAAHFTNSGTAAIAGSLKITGDINHQGGELTVDGAISAQNINTSGVWYSLGAIRTDRLTISGTETFVSMGSVEAASAIKNGDSSATADSVKGVTYFRENVTAESLENNRVLGTSGNVEISRSVITGFDSVWNAFGSVEVGSHITNYGTINLSENLTVAATGSSGADPGSSEITNYGTINGTSANAVVLVDGNLSGRETERGTITGLTALTVRGNAENNNIQMGNANSTMTVDGALTNAAVSNVGNLTVKGAVTDSTISGAGNGSVATLDSGVSGGSINNVDDLKITGDVKVDAISGVDRFSFLAVNGNLAVDGAISRFGKVNIEGTASFDSISDAETLIVAGKVSNDGTITATDQGSTYEFKDGLDNNENGTIRHVESLFVNRELNNNGTISGTGFDSSLKVKGNLNNGEYIDGFESLLVTGTLTNAGTITATGTGANYRMTNLVNGGNLVDVEKLVVTEQSNVSGNLVGTGNGSLYRTGSLYGAAGTGSVPETGAFTGSITQFGEVSNAADLVNDGTISGIGANAIFNQTGNLTNNKSISQFQYAAIDGSVVNGATGVLNATGVGSVWQISETLTNRGQVRKVETLNVLGTGTSENFGIIAGTGAGSRYEFAGNLINQEGAVLGSVGDLRVGGDLTNTGVLAFNQSITVDGDFTNGIDNGDGTYSGKGTLVLNCENGQLGQITVNGHATINGGRVVIEGERLAVGQNYVFLTVEGAEAGALNHDPAWADPAEPKNKGLTVNQAFQIFATNEAYLENAQLTSAVPMVSSAVPKLFHAEGFYNQDEYWVSLRRDYVYGANGRTDNQIAVGSYLDRIAYSLNTQNDWYEEGDLFKVLSALDDISHCNAPSYESGAGEVSGSNVDDYGYDTTDPNNPAYPYGYPVSGYAADGTPVYGVNAQALDALDQLSGSVYANMSAMTLQNGWFVHQNLANILRPLDCMCNCDNPNARDHNVWGAALGNAGRIESDGNSAGFHYNTYGLIVGSDLFRSECFRLGGFFQYVNADLGQRSNGSRSDIDNYDLGLYFMHHFAAGYVMATGSVGYSAYDTARTLRFGGEHASVNRTHFSDSDSSLQSFRLERAWDFSLGKGKTLLRPFVGLTYVHLQMDGVDEYSQDGGRYVTQLSSDGYELDSLRSELGLRVSRCFETSCANIGLNARASWVHEFGDTQTTIENRFNNPNYSDQTRAYGSPYMNPSDNAFGDASSSFIVSGVNLNDDYAWLGLGFTANTNSCWTFFGGYDALVNGKTVIHTGNLGAALNW